MINIVSYDRLTKVLVYEENGIRNEVEYFSYTDSIPEGEEIHDLVTFTFNTLLMLEISLHDFSILSFTFECFSDGNVKRDFTSYGEFVEEMCKQSDLSEDEKNVLIQTLEWEKTAEWNME